MGKKERKEALENLCHRDDYTCRLCELFDLLGPGLTTSPPDYACSLIAFVEAPEFALGNGELMRC